MIVPAHAPVVRQFAPYVPQESMGDVIPDVRLIDQDGRSMSLRNAAHPTIVSFAYTRCPDPAMCSLVTTKFAVLQRSLTGSGIRLVEITLDPAYDRPAKLHAYAAAVGARPERWSFATGRPDDVLALARRLGVIFDRSRADAIAHTELVAIVSGDGTLLDRIDGARWSPGDVAAQARADAGLRANPLQRVALRLLASASAACGGRGGGVTVLAAIALFVTLTVAMTLIARRLCAPARLERQRS